MGAQRALGRGPRSAGELDAVVVALVDRLARRLRAAGRVCRTVVLRLRFDDFSRATRSHTLTHATDETQTILATARGLLAAALPMIEKRGITLVGVALGNLEDAGPSSSRCRSIVSAPAPSTSALDDLRERYGSAVITRGVLVGRDQGLSVPLLPD